MALILETPAVTEALLLSEVKLFLKIDDDAEDLLLTAIISAARVQLENYLNMAFIRQKWSLYFDDQPPLGIIKIPIHPAISVDNLAVVDATGIYNIIDEAFYKVNINSAEPKLIIEKILPKPHIAYSGYRLQFWAGFGVSGSDLPAPLKLALLNLVAHWYEHRGGNVSLNTQDLPPAMIALIAPFRKINI